MSSVCICLITPSGKTDYFWADVFAFNASLLRASGLPVEYTSGRAATEDADAASAYLNIWAAGSSAFTAVYVFYQGLGNVATIVARLVTVKDATASVPMPV